MYKRQRMGCNPKLTELICQAIGDKWIHDPEALSELKPFADDKAFREKFARSSAKTRSASPS